MSNQKRFSRRLLFRTGAAALTAAPLAAQQATTPEPVRSQRPEPPPPPSPGKFVRSDAPLKAKPFPLTDVRLGEGPCKASQEVNRKLLHELPLDGLLYNFRKNAGLQTPGAPLGGWELPDCELRGHFTGHFLSASAHMYQSTADEELKKKSDAMVAEMAKCQKALNNNGYLSAFPVEFLERLKTPVPKQAWAPFYTYHKILAGMIDMAELTGSAQALEVAEGMASFVGKYLDGVDDDTMQRALRVEFGGMAEALYNLAGLTGKTQYGDWGNRFYKKAFMDPLYRHRDQLQGLHANTHVPQVIGMARNYELTSEFKSRDIAQFFWDIVVGGRTYATGGTSNEEGWRADPGMLAAELRLNTEECCVSYNMLKLTRHLFTWTADPRFADYYERHIFNTRLGTQYPEDGSLMYYLPLVSGYWKTFGLPARTCWCCTGTGIEEFSKMGDSIYFHDDDGVYVNLFIASEVNWKEKGVRIRQETDFPQQEGTTLVITAAKPAQFALRIRVPYWVQRGASVRVNGAAVAAFAEPTSYITLQRTWKTGDKVEVTLPMALHAAPLPDDRTQVAAMYGPLVLAATLGKVEAKQLHGGYGPSARDKAKDIPTFTAGGELASWIEPAPDQPLTFRTKGQPRDVTLVPFYRVLDERYAVYLKVTR
jgi:DUF1680 family protein